MDLMSLSSPLAAAVLLAPSLCLAIVGFLGDAPGEWGRAALIAWTSLVAALLAGAALQSGAGALAWLALALGLAAIMIGGPPGLVVAAVAVAALGALATGLPTPRWLPLGLALAPLALGLRHLAT